MYLSGFLTLVFYLRCAVCDIDINVITDDGSHELTLKLNEIGVFYINISNTPSNLTNTTFQLIAQHPDIIKINPTEIKIDIEDNLPINVTAVGAGHSKLAPMHRIGPIKNI
ncbi:hypothetical protein JTB14_005665 [Gonioctena quinquepunctata]|nr:hypothetical protein JTB14_005665 [Gonioctena quinquepunctata]